MYGGGWSGMGIITSCINRFTVGRTSLLRVAENIITCFSCGVFIKICWTSARMSTHAACNTNDMKDSQFSKTAITPTHTLTTWLGKANRRERRKKHTRLTGRLKHLVAFVKDKVLEVREIKRSIAHKREHTPWGAHDNVLSSFTSRRSRERTGRGVGVSCRRDKQTPPVMV